MPETFIETDCTVTHDGHTFTAGGAWLCDCTDGKRRGVVYAKPSRVTVGPSLYRESPHECAGTVTTWHGGQIARASFGRVYRGNYCRMRSVSFDCDGWRYTGRYCPDTSQAVRVTGRKL